MKIIVCIKQVPGTSQVQIDPKTGVLIRDGVSTKMNPYDLFALESALRLREERGGEVVTLSMGPPQAREAILESFYMGADEGYLLTDRKFAGADVVATSYTLSQGVEKITDYSLILCGKQTTDGDTAQVGPEMAEFLNIPHATNISEILEITDDYIIVRMNQEETIDTIKIKLPCLITVDKDIFTPRLPSYKRKRALQGKKEVFTLTLQDLDDQEESHYGLKGSPTQVEQMFPPSSDNEKEMHQGSAEELADILHQILSDKKFLKTAEKES